MRNQGQDLLTFSPVCVFLACSRGIAGLQCRGRDPVEDGSPPACACLRRRARTGISRIQFPTSRLDFPGDFDPRGLRRDSAIRFALLEGMDGNRKGQGQHLTGFWPSCQFL
jgi:hypothetical protein